MSRFRLREIENINVKLVIIAIRHNFMLTYASGR